MNFKVNLNDTLNDLVKHLEHVASDDSLYASYFWWRDYYEVRNSQADRAQAFCDLCAHLNNPNESTKTYPDMYQWWVKDPNCKIYSQMKNK